MCARRPNKAFIHFERRQASLCPISIGFVQKLALGLQVEFEACQATVGVRQTILQQAFEARLRIALLVSATTPALVIVARSEGVRLDANAVVAVYRVSGRAGIEAR